MGIGAGVALLCIPLYMMCKQRIVDGKFVAPPLAIEVAESLLLLVPLPLLLLLNAATTSMP